MSNALDQPPGYHEALAAESEARDLSFLDFPELVCGMPVLPLDLRNQIILTHAHNPFLVGGAANIEDVRMLLWLQSPLYVAGDAEARATFVNSLPVIEEVDAVAQTRAWIDETFADAPAGRTRPKGSEGAVIEEPIASFVASWVDLVCSEYSWPEWYVIGTAARRGVALKRLFQYHRMIARRHNPKATFSSGIIARLLGNWLRAGIKQESSAPADKTA